MGFMALGIGVWVVVYLGSHGNLDPVSRGIALTTLVVSSGFGGYVLIRRIRRGPQS
jgi:hypothetical protein